MNIRRHWQKLIVGVVILCLDTGAASGQPSTAPKGRVLRVAYFVPADRQPEPNYMERVDRIMAEIQRFYGNGLKENGFGVMTFELDRDANGSLNILTVKGREPARAYNKEAKEKVRDEVSAAFAKAGIDMDHETVIIFQVLIQWSGAKATEVGPFVGGGTGYKGSALIYDDARLDPNLLPSKQPGGYFNGPCSLGKFNSHYIGGAAHELGHAFGLAHDAERAIDGQRKGRSLMGRGNHTYGEERRREGLGSFLTPASALALSLHPLFSRKQPDPTVPKFTIPELEGMTSTGSLTLSGRIAGDTPKAAGLVAYNDPQAESGDYDAQGWPCRVLADGTFQVTIQDLQPGDYALRIRVYGENGIAKQFRYQYTVDRFGRANLSSLAEAN